MLTKLLLGLLLLGAVLAVDPSCQTLEGGPRKLYVLPTETQLLELSDYFRGYNMTYSLRAGAQDSKLVEPFYLDDTQPLPTLPDDANLVALDILLNDQKAWAEQGVLLANNADFLNSTILYGTLTDKYNLQFGKNITVVHSEPTICFDITMVGINIAVADCQTLGDSNQDSLYMSDSTGYIAYKFDMKAKITGMGRRSIVYRSSAGVFLLTATLYDHVDAAFSINTFINVYWLDLEMKQLRFNASLGPEAFGLAKLSLTDITFDALGNIYITDAKQGIFRFTLDGIKVVGLTNFAMPGSLQVYSVTTADQRLMVYVATNTLVQQLDWTDTTADKLATYEMPERVNKIRDLQVNSKTIMVEADNNYYFYKLGETSAKNTLFIVANQATACLMDQSSPQAIVVGLKNSLSYVMTDGFLKVVNPPQDQTATVDAVSSSGMNTKTCTVELSISSVYPDSIGTALQIKDPPASINAESPATVVINLNDYYTGSRLQYLTKKLSPLINYERRTVQDHQVNGLDVSSSSFLATISVTATSHYRISRNQQIYTSQLCLDGRRSHGTNCGQKRQFAIQGQLITFDTFETQLDGQTIHVMAFVSDLTPTVVQFQPLNVYPSIDAFPTITSEYNVAHIEANRLYVFLTIRDDPAIIIVQADMDTYPEVTRVTTRSFTQQQLNQIVRFRPRSVTLSPVNPNILFVRNLQSVLVMRFSKTGLLFIANIPVLQVADARVDWAVFAGNRTLAIVVASDTTNSIVEYSVYDVYKPLFLKELNVMGEVFMTPLNIAFAPTTDFLAIETVNDDATPKQISVYKLDSQAVATNYYSVAATQRSVFVTSSGIDGDVILEIASTKVAKRLYYQPKIIITASSDPSTFKSNLAYGMSVVAPNNILEFTGNLGVYNYQTKITERAGQNDKLNFPSSSTDTKVEMIADDMFNGSVTHYEIWCSWCGDKIKLIDHVSSLNNVNTNQHTNRFLNLKGLNLIAGLLDGRVEFYSSNYNIQGSVDLGIQGVVCTNMQYWANNILVLFCETVDQKQWFVPVTVQAADVTSVGAPIAIGDDWRIDECLQIAFAGDQLLALDNNRNSDGNGYIRSFTISQDKDSKVVSIVGGNTLNSDSFGSPTSQLVMGMAMLNTSSADYWLLLVTLESYGLGYITYVGGEWKGGNNIDLKSSTKAQDYVLDDSNFLQILPVESSGGQPFKNTVILTVSDGAHMLVSLGFSKVADNTYNFSGMGIQASYHKYGQQKVLNWVDAVLPQSSIGCFGVMYFNSDRQLITLAIYELPNNLSSHTTLNFKTSVNQSVNDFDEFQALMFRPPSSQEGRMLASGFGKDGNTNTTLYNLSSRVYLQLNYNKIGDFPNITVTAFNDYCIAAHNVTINFDGADGGGLGWVLYLIIGLSALFLLGVVYGLYKFIKRKRMEKKKVSLLDEDQEQV